MKKFLVSILGIFLLFGAALLTACGGSNPSLKLSQDTVAIQLYAEDEDSGYQIVTAELSGVDSGKIQASALSGYENVVKVSTSTLSSTKCSIRIEGLEEGTAQVVVRATPGNIEKRINVTVFSEVSAMSQVVENDKKKNNFLIRGEANSLIEEKLISFQPSSNSRRTLTWAIAEEMNMAGGLTLDGTTLTVEDTFVGNEVILDATTEKGVSTKITLPVVDKIESEVKLAFSYSQNSSFDEINEENNIFNIVPNIPTDECYTGYILVDYIGDLEITPYVIESATGKTSDDIQVMIQGNYEGKPLYAVYASKDKPDINKDYEIGFKIGYENFNYFIDTAKDFPITIKARELVNGITISTNEANNIAGSVQTLYTNYVDSASASINGQKFDISITPTTVIDATKKYSIDVERLSGGGIVADGCPIEAYYKDELNGNVWTQVIFTLDGNGHYVTREEDYPSAATLYLKASSSLKEQVVEGFRITFVSQDNTDISTSFNLRLVKSASLSEFAFNDAGFRIDSSVLYKEYKKTFTLKGQTSIDGLYIINNSKNVIFDDITEVSHDEESVTFSVSLNLKTTSYGQTSLDSYQIAHRNGLISDSYDLDIFLPLKYGSMFIDTTTENRSNSVIDSALSNKVYTTAGTETTSSPVGSLSRLILKNNTTTPLFYTYNTINGISAVANIGVSFYDFDSENDDIDHFKGLINTADGILNIIRGATERGDTSNVAYFSSDRTSISTKSVGHTYAVISFTGKGVDGTDANGQVTYVRIIYIESFVTPEALSVNPESDKNVSLYAFDTLATSDEALTRKTINIRFKNSNVTYNSLDYNLEFVSTNGAMGDMKVSGDTVTWSNGCYSISGIKITEEGITFTIEALSISKYEDTIFTDSLNVHYVIRDGKSDTSKKIYDIYTPIDIVIKNAQRIENLKWKNYDDEGLYFEVGDDQPQYLLLETSPNSARNKSVAYIITDQNNSTNSKFVSVSDAVSSNILSINLANSIKNGMTGYIYILPADAIYNNQIRYYYMDGDKEKSGSISDTDLPSQYEYLVSNAYFKSNAFDGTTKTVKFSDIIVKIKVTVADGKSFEYAYRIYDNNAFKNMRPELYYNVMNNLDLSGEERSAITSFSGGLQGANKDITVRLSGANFAGTIAAGGQVRNITFVGDITTGNGFVANVNNGKLSNITIDVNGLKPSSITASGIVGGLVGENNGEIDGCRVLGLNIFGGTDYVGGIAGKNLNKISNSKVEFYNLENGLDSDNKVTYASNKFRGGVVGGVVGYMSASASINHSYAYDYTIAPNSSAVLISNLQEGGKLGQLVGDVETADGKRATIDYSFAVLSGGIGTLCNNENITITNSYYAYYSGSSYITDATMQTENSNFVSASDNDPAYKAYVNKGNPHLRDLVQDEPVSSVNSLNIKTSSANGYYKSLEVKSTDSVSRGVLFNYSLKDGAVELNASEQNGLNQLNTITLSELLGTSVSANVIVSSSNSNIVKVLGSSLQIVGCGDTTIRLSSKQDVTNNKVISIKVVYALSDLMISWTDSAGRVTYVQEESQLTLQRTHSRYYGVNFENSQVYLGNLATAYELKQNENASLNILVDKVDITNDKGEVINQDNEKVFVGEGDISISGFKVLTNSNSTLSKFRVSPSIFDETVFQNAVNDAFTRNFFINAIDGVISFDISGESIPLTPSTTANIEVRIKTTMLNDKVYPIISLNGLELDRKEGEGKNTNLYTIKGQDEAILEVTSTLIKIEESQKATSGDLNTYTYNVVFAVNPAYRERVSQDMDFDVYMMSDSGNSSKDWKGEFKLHLTRQNFTNIDVSNRKISSSIFKNINGTIVEEHTASEPVSVLAPGKSSILQINVNPKFAYYDHVDLVYSNATVSDALNIEVVKETGNDTFVRRVSENGDIEPVGSGLRFYPKAAEKGSLYYKLWVNTTVNRDSTIKLTAYFYDNSSETPITYVNYYISISYLTEPTIKVDGASTAYVARGSYATIQIDVLADQSIDSLLLADDDGRDGVIITQPSKPVIDKDKGIKTYTANLYASVLAKATNDTVYLTAQVSRELNGSKEFKTSVATVVLVDFKLQENSIVVDEKPEGNVVIWQGVNKPITFDYDLLPEDYGAASNPELEKAIADLRAKRDLFLGAQYYPARLEENDEGRNYLPLGKNKDYNNGNEIVGNNNEKLEDYKYFINYKYDENNELKVQTIEDRLYFVSGYDRIPISDDAVEKPFDYKFDPNSNSIVFTGIRIASAVQMVLKTYISAGGITREIETPFTVSVEAYSDPDLPLLIKSAKDFKNLNPNKSSEGTTPTPQDYILTKDILLEDYTAFDTSLIRSLDGNGYTIHIRSFNMPENTSTLNLALFNNVSEDTILKNVRVNIYNGGQITVNTFKYSEVNVAGFAIENAGIITNCEVVSYYTTNSAVGDIEELNYPACVKHNYPSGINVTYTRGENTEPDYIVDNADWSTQISGFVISNQGSITNSRVGGDSITVLGDEKMIDGQASGRTYASKQELDTFYMIGQGNMTGFVGNNSSGNISACFVKKLDMENQSKTTQYYAAGFVGVNSSTINVSYIEGVPTDPAVIQADPNNYSVYAYEGSSIKSKMGYVVGFVYKNDVNGKINDSYSNILISNTNDSNSVYLASGYVYENEGKIENGYSASQIRNQMNTQMNFSGVNRSGELLAKGEYINCYFFNKQYNDIEDTTDDTTETQNNTGAVMIPEPDEESLFYGFAIANGENDGIWKIIEDKGIFLVSTDFISVSHRYIYRVDDNIFEGVAGEDDQGKYILPYSTLTFTDSSTEINTALGGEFNPIIIKDAEDFIAVSGTSTSSYIKEYFNSSALWGTYRLVDDINLGDIASGDNVIALPSSSKAFAGTFYGNGFTISGLSIATEQEGVGFGLFKSIEKRGRGSNPVVKNLNINVTQVDGSVVTMSGALAGYIKDAVIISIDIKFAENAQVTGLNFAGGLAGFVFGDNTIKCIRIENPNVKATKSLRDDEGTSNYFISKPEGSDPRALQTLRTRVGNNLNYNTSVDASIIQDTLANYSYAGGMFGFADIFKTNNNAFDINQSKNYAIKNVRVFGEVYIEGQVAGGVFGLAGYQTNVRDIGLTITGGTNSHILATKYFAGGIVGQSFGTLTRVFAVHDDETQDKIENNMGNFYNGNEGVERGNLDLFSMPGTNYTQKYVGGLIGVAFSGNLEISYSKLNVTAPNASYAGGVIGGLELNGVDAYQLNTEGAGSNYYSSYFIDEVYASGDIRANVYAGGIIGRIVGEAARVGLHSVNAFNYFTTYDYTTGEYAEIEEGTKNFSELFKVNSIVGKFANVTVNESNVVVGIHDISDLEATQNYSKYISFIEHESVNNSDEGQPFSMLPSVGYYEGYYKDSQNNLITLSIFGKLDGRIEKFYNEITGEWEYKNPLYGELIYAIESPSSYTNASAGYQYTNTGFLGSGVWSETNWEHSTSKLFPSIKYKRTSSVIYLDAYNESIDKVFRAMCDGQSHVVYIRGLTSEGSDSYQDIDLRKYYADDKFTKTKISNFSGRIKGGIYPIDIAKKVRIITDRNFIESVAPGFNAVDVDIVYVPKENEEKIVIGNTTDDDNLGLFVNSKIEGATISGLTLELANTVEFRVKGKPEVKVGLVSPEILDSTLSNINIKVASDITTSTDSSGYIMNIQNNSIGKGSDQSVYAGLITGMFEQQSSNSPASLENVNIEWSGDLINVGAIGSDSNYYIGGYVGLADRKAKSASETLSFNLNEIKKSGNLSENNPLKISISGNNPAEKISVGGFIGSVGDNVSSEQISSSGITGITITEKKEINVVLDIAIDSSTLNAGGFIGEAKGSGFIMKLANSTLNSGLMVASGKKIKENLNAGGVVGKSMVGLTVENLSAVEFGVVGYTNAISNTLLESQKEVFKEEYNNDVNPSVQVDGQASVGGFIGDTLASFKITGDCIINDRVEKNEKFFVNSFRVSAENIFMGSLVGHTVRSVVSESTIKSDTEFVAIGDNTIIGGFVGILENGGINRITSSNYNVFDGAIMSNSKNFIFGGVVGKYIATDKEIGEQDSSSTKQSELDISNSAIGAAVKIYGDNNASGEEYPKVTTGGTIGYISLGAGSAGNAKTSIQKSYNYGDVFVEYGEKLSLLKSYVFGGIIGEVESDIIFESIANNYSVMTSHNSKYSTTAGTVNALFGTGIVEGENGNVTQLHDNYYNHAIALANDELGNDIAAYDSTNYLGYNYNSENNGKNIIESFGDVASNVGKLTLNKIEGTLNNLSEIDTFNGIKYYYLNVNTINSHNGQIKDSVGTKDADGDFELKNIAIIGGNGQRILFNNNENEVKNESTISSIIGTLSGFSYVSGFVVEADIVYENTDSLKTIAPLVKEMHDNSIVYAINVKGTFEVGGSTTPNVSGIVGIINSGRIFDCSTDLDIIYRASKNTSNGVFGIARMGETDKYKLIENTYASGSITSYMTTNVYAFANSQDESYVRNSYAINKLDLKDYTTESNEMENTAKVDVFGYGATANITGWHREYLNCYFDYDALNYWSARFTNDEIPKNSIKSLKYSDLKNTSLKENTNLWEKTGFDNSKWTVDLSYNYGYPTLKYQYLKTSSFVYLESSTTKLASLKAEGQKFTDYNGTRELSDEENYDNYIRENKYKRYMNGTSPYKLNVNATNGENTKEQYTYQKVDRDKEIYFMIPNAALLTKRKELYDKLSGDQTSEENTYFANFILKYDIDLERVVGNFTEDYNDTTSTGVRNKVINIFLGNFDGQNKNINKAKIRLFNIIGKQLDDKNKSAVVNLRFTNIEVSNGKSILANEINNSFISNILLSGKITGSNSVIGALAEKAKNKTILNNITNLVEINMVDDSCDFNVGGIVGEMYDSQMLFCSNYGPLNAQVSSGKTLMLGGLTGVMYSSGSDSESKIAYSYNATSVLGNYASSTSTATSNGLFFTGGLVGYMAGGKINNSYNSGMVKSGNKSNVGTVKNKSIEISNSGITINEGTSFGNAAYAGGIIAYAAEGSIINCYNEATIEALGSNPEYNWKWDSSSNLILRQNDDCYRNVYAYGIGYVENGVKIENSTIRLEKDLGDRETIYSNGTSLKEGFEIWRADWEDEICAYDGLSESFEQNLYYKYRWQFWFLGHIENLMMNHLNFIAPACSENSNKQDSGDADVNVKSITMLGLPRAFDAVVVREIYGVAKTYATQNSGLFWKWSDSQFEKYQYPNSKPESTKRNTSKFNDLYHADIDANTYYDLTYNNNDYKASNKILSGAGTTNENNAVKYNTRSHENSEGKLNSYINIGGVPFYIADSNNSEIFNAGITTKSFEYESELPYLGDKRYYKAVIKNSNGAIAFVTDVNKYEKEGKEYAKINYSISNNGDLQDSYSIDFSVKNNEEIIFNLSTLRYYYNNDYSFAFDLTGVSNYYLRNYSLKDAGGNSYDKIIRISKEQYTNRASEKEPFDSSYTYLAYQGDKYIYIPNAKLYSPNTPRGEEYVIVNKSSIKLESEVKSEEDEKIFAQNIQSLINNFAGKIFYNRVETSEFVYVETNYSSSGSATGSFNAGGEANVNVGGLNYGKVIANLVNNITFKNGSYEIVLNTTNMNTIGLSGSTAVVGYDFNNSSWIAADSVNINGKIYTAGITNNILRLNNSSDNGDNLSNIQSYFNSLQFIANTTINNVNVEDKFSSLNNEDIVLQLSNNAGKYTLKKEVKKEWYYNNSLISNGAIVGAYRASINSNNQLTLSVDNSKLTSYTLGNIKIYKGYLSTMSIKEKASTTILEATFTNHIEDGLTVEDFAVFQPKIIGNKTYIDEIAFKAGDTTINLRNELFDLVGTVNISATLRATIELSGEEGDDYILVLDGGENNTLVVDATVHDAEVVDGINKESYTEINSISKLIKVSHPIAERYVLLKRTIEGESRKIYKEKNRDNIEERNNELYYKGTNTKVPYAYYYNITYYASYFYQGDFYDYKIVEKNILDQEASNFWNDAPLVTHTRYYDKNGEIKNPEEEYGDIDNNSDIAFPQFNNDGRSTIKYSEFIKFENFISENSSLLSKDLLIRKVPKENTGRNEYVYINSSLPTTSFTAIWEDDSDKQEVEVTSFVKISEIAYEQFRTRDYNKVSQRFENQSYVYQENDFVSGYKWSNYENVKKTQDGNLYEVYLRGKDERLNLKVNIDKKKTEIIETNMESSGELNSNYIILSRDLSYDRKKSFSKSSEINIIGNNYTIKFYGEAFYNTMFYSENSESVSWISNVNFLGESYGTSFLVSINQNENSINAFNNSLYEVGLYGSVTNMYQESELDNSGSDTDNSNDEYDAAIINTKLKITNLKSYIAINNSITNKNKNDIVLFNMCEGEGNKNYGSIVARNGDLGRNAASSNKIVDYSKYCGEDGINGGSIKLWNDTVDEKLKMDNEGTLVAGLGGKGGAGASGVIGSKYYKMTTDNMQAYAGFDGLNGTCFNVANSNNSQTKSAYNGAVARASFDKIKALFKTNENDLNRYDQFEDRWFLVWDTNFTCPNKVEYRSKSETDNIPKESWESITFTDKIVIGDTFYNACVTQGDLQKIMGNVYGNIKISTYGIQLGGSSK